MPSFIYDIFLNIIHSEGNKSCEYNVVSIQAITKINSVSIILHTMVCKIETIDISDFMIAAMIIKITNNLGKFYHVKCVLAIVKFMYKRKGIECLQNLTYNVYYYLRILIFYYTQHVFDSKMVAFNA